MSDGDALLRAILEHPAEDTPRLMYADWLQENGQTERARFIRAMIERDRLEPFTDERLAANAELGVWWEFGLDPGGWMEIPASWGKVDWARGFIETVEIPLAAFMDRAEALFRAHPIERVTLTDREPMQWGNTAIWDWDTRYFTVKQCAGGADSIPHQLTTSAERGHGSVMFTERADAHNWLSARCVAYGRSLAGLTKIPLHA